MATQAMHLLDQAYKVFVLINNRFVAEKQAATLKRELS